MITSMRSVCVTRAAKNAVDTRYTSREVPISTRTGANRSVSYHPASRLSRTFTPSREYVKNCWYRR